jgi:hypothetical protein
MHENAQKGALVVCGVNKYAWCIDFGPLEVPILSQPPGPVTLEPYLGTVHGCNTE